MTRTIAFAFGIGDRVKIRETGHPAQVTGCMWDDTGVQFRAVWWNNGERKHEWLYGFELVHEPQKE